MKSRTYAVTETATGLTRVIEATTVANALMHVAKTTHTCEVVGGVEVAKLLASGVKFESAVKGDAV